MLITESTCFELKVILKDQLFLSHRGFSRYPSIVKILYFKKQRYKNKFYLFIFQKQVHERLSVDVLIFN